MTAVVGRDRELGKIARFLDLADGAPRVLLVEGEAGIGKTTLWRAGVDAARHLGYSVLACAGPEAEAQLPLTRRRRSGSHFAASTRNRSRSCSPVARRRGRNRWRSIVSTGNACRCSKSTR